VSSAVPTAAHAAEAVRGHCAIENGLHWVLDVVVADDQSRLGKGHGAHTMAILRYFAVNLLRSAPDPVRPEPLKLRRRAKPGAEPRPTSLKLRHRMAAWDTGCLGTTIEPQARQPGFEALHGDHHGLHRPGACPRPVRPPLKRSFNLSL
jgi:hypothetical protein